MNRARIAAATLAAAVAGSAALFLALAPAQALTPDATFAAAQPTVAQAPAASTPLVTASPQTDLATDGAIIKVHGEGFATTLADLYIAVCADGSTNLTNCVGGAVPDNNTSAWAHITADGTGSGGVQGKWNSGGFDVSLALPSVTSGSVNCVTGKCAVYGATAADTLVAGLKPVELSFKAPPSSSSSPASPTVPSTAIPQSIGSPSIVAGGTQKVIFSGFKAGEQVNLTLFSDPITLSPVTADGTGVAQVQFVVPADLAAGTHRLEAIGQQSGAVGVASFQVTAPPVPPTPSPTPSPTPTPSPSSSASSTSAVSSSAASSSAAPSSSAVTSSSSVAATGGDNGSNLWWLWLILAIVVIAGIITGVVVYRRNQQQRREQDEQAVAEAAARQQQAEAAQPGADAPTAFLPPVQPSGPPPGADPYGLLSGRDNPNNPTAYYDGQDPAAPTEYLGPQGYQGPGPYGQPLGYGGPAQGYGPLPESGPRAGQGGPPPAGPGQAGSPTRTWPPAGPSGPPTQAVPPAGSGPHPAGGPGGGGGDGTGTQSWSPDFDDTDTGSSGGEENGTPEEGGTPGGGGTNS